MTTKELISELQTCSIEYNYLGYTELANLLGKTAAHLEELEKELESMCNTCPYQKFYSKVKKKFSNATTNKEVEEIVDMLDEHGYNPIHIIGNLYLVRYNSTRFSWVPFYVPQIIKKPIDKYKKLW